MDPIMWDPFRYKLGGKLLNGQFEEFVDRYGGTDFGQYTATRDLASYSILKEAEAGRGSPHGGAYLDFRHIPEDQLRAAFGPVVDRLLLNGIDLTKTPVEVGPMAHYHMGGIRVNTRMETRVEGLYAAGEAVGGVNGANRLSGNAITEAFVLGERAGSLAGEATKHARTDWEPKLAATAFESVKALRNRRSRDKVRPVALQAELQTLMWENAGPFRTGEKLAAALVRIRQMQTDDLPNVAIAGEALYNLDLQDWFELRAMLTTAETVVRSALARNESRGAHQREDFPYSHESLLKNQTMEMRNGELVFYWTAPVQLHRASGNHG
jgi:succinate dehydrogenase/fumarate reductase flavoprotein subunit